MDKTLAEQWASALESGEFPQGQKYLETYEGKFCCLGVLCCILNVPRRLNGGIVQYNVPNKNAVTRMEDEWTASEYPSCIDGLNANECAEFACMNDSNVTFNEIAQVIRKRYLTEAN